MRRRLPCTRTNHTSLACRDVPEGRFAERRVPEGVEYACLGATQPFPLSLTNIY